MKYLSIVLAFALVLMTGCAIQPSDQAYVSSAESEAACMQSYSIMAQNCSNSGEAGLCTYMVAEKAASCRRSAPTPQMHPGWEMALRTINTVATLAIPAHYGVQNTKALADLTTGVVGTIANMDRSYTDNSVSIGGDQISGAQDNTDSSIGGDYIGGNQHVGDQYADSCVGDSCLNASPVDSSDHSDSSDNSDNSDNSNNSDNRQYAEEEPEPVAVE